ncbi:FMN-binding negative transcriptional regulator [Aliidiomarina soli]|nr:FMN-binding negative transcriptional regulator [Aliidiomarina soli]
MYVPRHFAAPSWYPTKAETGRVVPTWNYLAVRMPKVRQW